MEVDNKYQNDETSNPENQGCIYSLEEIGNISIEASKYVMKIYKCQICQFVFNLEFETLNHVKEHHVDIIIKSLITQENTENQILESDLENKSREKEILESNLEDWSIKKEIFESNLEKRNTEKQILESNLEKGSLGKQILESNFDNRNAENKIHKSYLENGDVENQILESKSENQSLLSKLENSNTGIQILESDLETKQDIFLDQVKHDFQDNEENDIFNPLQTDLNKFEKPLFPYNCIKCNETFSKLNEAQIHYRTVHRGQFFLNSDRNHSNLKV